MPVVGAATGAMLEAEMEPPSGDDVEEIPAPAIGIAAAAGAGCVGGGVGDAAEAAAYQLLCLGVSVP